MADRAKSRWQLGEHAELVTAAALLAETEHRATGGTVTTRERPALEQADILDESQ